jgi:hypothetical protein
MFHKAAIKFILLFIVFGSFMSSFNSKAEGYWDMNHHYLPYKTYYTPEVYIGRGRLIYTGRFQQFYIERENNWNPRNGYYPQGYCPNGNCYRY